MATYPSYLSLGNGKGVNPHYILSWEDGVASRKTGYDESTMHPVYQDVPTLTVSFAVGEGNEHGARWPYVERYYDAERAVLLAWLQRQSEPLIIDESATA